MLIYFLTLLLIKCYECEDTNARICRPRNRLITSDSGDRYSLAEVISNNKLILQCHYCNENDDEQPKVWYKFDNLNSSSFEVKIGMDNNSTLNRIQVNIEHSLILKNAHPMDFGLYYCEGLEGQESENKYNYFVDVIADNGIASEKGNLTDWKLYHEEYLMPVNKLFAISDNPELLYIRTVLGLKLEVVTEWDVWGKCQICGLPKGKRIKKGPCRLKISRIATVKNESIAQITKDELWFTKLPYFSCRSLHLQRVFPNVSNVTSSLPYFVQEEHCEGVCNPDAEGVNRGWKTGKSKDYKYKKSIVLAENAHITFVCPESSLENEVIWRKDGRILQSGEPSEMGSEPTITVDSFSTLYLYGVTYQESGNYTCQVDNVKMQQIKVIVVSKSRLLTQAFLRHMMYLGFILCLTLPCYAAGLFMTWKRRHTFKGYKELRRERLKKLRRQGRILSEEEEQVDASWMDLQ